MAVSTTHPSPASLRDFAQGRLDQDAEQVIYAHIEACSDCRRVASEASGDEFIKRLMAVSSRSGTPAPAKSLSGLAGAMANSSSRSTDIPPELASASQYEVFRELGRGGMGVVYLARNTLLAREEVLKVVAREFLDRPGAVDRFLREMQLAARLQHPNVVTAYNALRLGDLLAFAMEYVDGQDLAVVVRDGGPLPIRTACIYARQVALGLQHAFEKGMVHRDIKPSNLMLIKEGKRHTVKILDFGLAKAVSDNDAATDLTGSGRVLGTPDYMAPEQIRDAASARTTADVYSLGGTLFYLLTGSPPFRAQSLADLFDAHRFSPPPWLPEHRSDVPKELAVVLARMMAKEPADRFQSPGEVAQALAPFLTNTSTSAPPSSVLVAVPVPSVTPSAASGVSGVVRRASLLQEANPESGSPSRSRMSPHGDEPPVKARSGVGKRSRKSRSGRGAGLSSGTIAALVAVGVVAAVSAVGAAMWADGVFRLKTESGSEIVLTGLPADADVFVDDEKVTVTAGRDQAVISAVAAGNHTVRVVRNGVELTSSDVTVPLDGSPVRVRVDRPRTVVGSGPGPASGATGLPPADATGFVSLFNGKDLSGWEQVFEKGIWKVEDGILTGTPAAADNAPVLVYTGKSFDDFHLRAELEFGGLTGTGVFVHHQERGGKGTGVVIDTGTEVGSGPGTLVRGGERGWSVNDRPTAQIAVKPGEFGLLEVISRGGQLDVYINRVRMYSSPRTTMTFRDGRIGLRVRGTDTILRVKSLEIKPLAAASPSVSTPTVPTLPPVPPPPAKPNYPPFPVAEPEPAFVTLFNGTDLSAWQGDTPGRPPAWAVVDGTTLVDTSTMKEAATTRRDDFANFHLRFDIRPYPKQHANGTSIHIRKPVDARPGHTSQGGYYLSLPISDGSYAFANISRAGHGVISNQVPPMTPGEWHRVDVIVDGNLMTLSVNGKELARMTDPVPVAAAGQIALNPGYNTVIAYRNIRIKELPPSPPPQPPTSPPAGDEFVSLFNGKDLAGWIEYPDKDERSGRWEVRAGELFGQPDSRKTVDMFTDRGDYTDVHIRAEVMVDLAAAGSLAARAMYEHPATFNGRRVDGYHLSIDSLGPDLFKTGSLILPEVQLQNPNRFIPIFNAQADFPPPAPGEWAIVELLVAGNRLQTRVNGKDGPVLIDPDRRWASGRIALSVVKGSKGPVRVRKVEVKRLAPNALDNVRPSADDWRTAKPQLRWPDPSADGFTPLFNGRDLSDWSKPSFDARWTVADGKLIAEGARREAMIFHNQPIPKDFDLRAEFTVTGACGNDGISIMDPALAEFIQDFQANPRVPGRPGPQPQRPVPPAYQSGQQKINQVTVHFHENRPGMMSPQWGGWGMGGGGSVPDPADRVGYAPNRLVSLEISVRGGTFTARVNGENAYQRRGVPSFAGPNGYALGLRCGTGGGPAGVNPPPLILHSLAIKPAN